MARGAGHIAWRRGCVWVDALDEELVVRRGSDRCFNFHRGLFEPRCTGAGGLLSARAPRDEDRSIDGA